MKRGEIDLTSDAYHISYLGCLSSAQSSLHADQERLPSSVRIIFKGKLRDTKRMQTLPVLGIRNRPVELGGRDLRLGTGRCRVDIRFGDRDSFVRYVVRLGCDRQRGQSAWRAGSDRRARDWGGRRGGRRRSRGFEHQRENAAIDNGVLFHELRVDQRLALEQKTLRVGGRRSGRGLCDELFEMGDGIGRGGCDGE
jgi:hypothetical protein